MPGDTVKKKKKKKSKTQPNFLKAQKRKNATNVSSPYQKKKTNISGALNKPVWLYIYIDLVLSNFHNKAIYNNITD